MNKNFSRFAVFLFFYLTTSTHTARASIKWSNEMDNALKAIVATKDEKTWEQVALETSAALGDIEVNKVQCSQRWLLTLAPGIVSGPWTGKEDQRLRSLVSASLLKNGKIDFKEIAGKISGRTAKKCRERWNNHLDPKVKKGEWSKGEGQFIVEKRQKKWKWSDIAKELQGRTQNSIRIHYYSLIRKGTLRRQAVKKTSNMGEGTRRSGRLAMKRRLGSGGASAGSACGAAATPTVSVHGVAATPTVSVHGAAATPTVSVHGVAATPTVSVHGAAAGSDGALAASTLTSGSVVVTAIKVSSHKKRKTKDKAADVDPWAELFTAEELKELEKML